MQYLAVPLTIVGLKQEALLLQRNCATRLSVETLQLQNISLKTRVPDLWCGISNLPQFTNMHPKSKKEKNSDKHWTTGLHIKLGDNVTNNDRDILTDISNST